MNVCVHRLDHPTGRQTNYEEVMVFGWLVIRYTCSVIRKINTFQADLRLQTTDKVYIHKRMVNIVSMILYFVTKQVATPTFNK